jgi:hypothetical protein
MDDRERVDMEQSTGGHYLDTGDGPVHLDPPEMTPQRAWDTYQAHRRDCPQCQTSVFRCADGNILWNGYIAATT